MRGELPKAIRSGAAKQQQRRTGGVLPAPTPKQIIDAKVPIRPVIPPPRASMGAASASIRPSAVAPAFGAQRLTAQRAVQLQRDKGRARALEAGPAEASRSYRREVKTIKAAGIAAMKSKLTRENPASPQADLLTGRLRYSGAFTSHPFRAPFQKSYNLRRSFGA